VGYLKPGFHPGDLEVPPEAAQWEQQLEVAAA
jgi:predicted metal-dependent hydrolase